MDKSGPSIASAQHILADTTVFCNFADAGASALNALAGHVSQLQVVADVQAEIERRYCHAGHASLRPLVDAWPFGDALTLPVPLRQEVASVLAVRRFSHPDEDLGETATVFYARHRRDEAAENWLVLTDDTQGRKLAERKGVAVTDTPALVIEMVCVGALDLKLGGRVWRSRFASNRKKWNEYEVAVRAACPERLPDKLT